MDCPVCGVALPGGAAGEAHVNAHFEEAPSAGAAARAPCAVCGALVAAGEADSHAMAHALQAADFAAAVRAGGASSQDAIDLCDDDDDRPPVAAAAPRPRLALSALPGASVAEPAPAVAEGLHGLLRSALLAQPAQRGFFRAALAGPPLLHYGTADGIDAGCAPPARRMKARALL